MVIISYGATQKVTHTINQAALGNNDITTTFDNYSISVGEWSSGNKSITPITGVPWVLTSDAGITLAPLGNQSRATTIATASIGANNTNSARPIKYYLSYGDFAGTPLKNTYTITQAAPVLAVSATQRICVERCNPRSFEQYRI